MENISEDQNTECSMKAVPVKKKKSHIRKKRILLCTIAALFLIWLLWGNVTVGLTVYELENPALPKSFDGFRIAQVSDLHNSRLGKENGGVLAILQKSKPDIIVLTGDLVDSGHTDRELAVAFAGKAAEIAPCYYVTGNHEAWLSGDYAELERLLKESGVTVLHNQSVTLQRGEETISLIGVDDPDYLDSGNSIFDPEDVILKKSIERAGATADFQILLSHRPEAFTTYAEAGVDLALTGHAHGGQFRLPFVGGVVAPSQGLFPKYDAGIYREKETTMVVSRGVGNSVIPVRVNNRPEVVLAVLKAPEK